MSAYNGKRYLREQLDTILSQDCEREGLAGWRLVVRDDGSLDGTQKILEEYARKYPKKIRWVQGKNRGAIRSFFSLLKGVGEAEYYAFADQDDYWMPDKMSAAIRMLDRYQDCKVPHLYCCRPKLVDAHLRELPSQINRAGVRPSFANALVENIVTGCTVVMNGALRTLVTAELPRFTLMHDRWLYLTAECFGTLDYDESSYICYRQHGNNAVGTNTRKSKEWKERLLQFRRKQNGISRQSKEFLRIFGDLEAREDLKGYRTDRHVIASLSLARDLAEGKTSFAKRVALLQKGELYRQRKMDDRIFQILILLGIY